MPLILAVLFAVFLALGVNQFVFSEYHLPFVVLLLKVYSYLRMEKCPKRLESFALVVQGSVILHLFAEAACVFAPYAVQYLATLVGVFVDLVDLHSLLLARGEDHQLHLAHRQLVRGYRDTVAPL